MLELEHNPAQACALLYNYAVNPHVRKAMEQDSFDAIIPVGGGLVSYRMKYSDVIKIDDFEKFSSIESRPVAHDSHSGTCAICLEEFEEGEMVPKLPCQHNFHTRCLFVWTQTRCKHCVGVQCPVCNRVLFSPILNTDTSQGEEKKCAVCCICM